MTPRAPVDACGPRFTLADLAARLGGRAEGEPGLVLTGVAGLAEAGPGELTFAAGRRALERAGASAAGAFIVAEDAALPGRSLIRAANPRLAFAAALALFHPAGRPPAGIHASALVEPGAEIDPAASVGAFCWVGAGARIGPRTVLHPFVYVGAGAVLGSDALLYPMVTIRERVRVGDRVIVHSGAVVGSDGFGYEWDGRRHVKIPQVGTVEIGDDVELGSCSAIDRATTGVTRVGRGTKIDNLVQVGHNVTIGEHSLLVGQVGVSGSSRIGSGVVLGGQVGVADHVDVGDGARAAAQAGIVRDVPAGSTVGGYGPQPFNEWLRSRAIYDQLPELRRRVLELERRLAALGGPPEPRR